MKGAVTEGNTDATSGPCVLIVAHFRPVGARVRSASAMELLSPVPDEVPQQLPQDADADGPRHDSAILRGVGAELIIWLNCFLHPG